MLPDYIIIGTQRGGTTSLHNYICAHPAVAQAGKPNKEIHFFDYPAHYGKGRRWYEAIFEPHKGKMVGEKSPTYLDHPLVPGRVKALCPRVKLLAVLRDPVERAYSDYHKIRSIGREPLDTFEAALDAEPERMEAERARPDFWEQHYFGSAHHVRSYLRRGRYAKHLQRWLTTFRADQLLVLKSESLFAHPRRVMRLVWQFLELPEFEVQHAYWRYQWLERERQPMKRKTRRKLRKYFEPHNRRLEQLIGGQWWQQTSRR